MRLPGPDAVLAPGRRSVDFVRAPADGLSGDVYLFERPPNRGLADVLELALDEAQGALESARIQDVLLRGADKVRELQAASVRVEDKTNV